jgi:hypothetical protein
VDQELWERYAVKIEGMDIDAIEAGDVSQMEIKELKAKAASRFTSEFKGRLKDASMDDLIEAFYNIVLYPTGPKLIKYFYPQLLDSIDKYELENEVLPKLMMYCAVSKERVGCEVLEAVLEKGKANITPDAANACLEYTCHILDSNCGSVVLSHCKDLLQPAGIANAFLVCAVRGNERMFSLLQLIFSDKLQEEVKMEQPSSFFEKNELACYTDTTVLIYVYIAVSAISTNAQLAMISELVNFYMQGTLVDALQRGGMTDKIHQQFITTTFDLACRSNHATVLESLIDIEWIPVDITLPVIEAVELGHQVVIHSLLDSLLAPDTKITFESGAIPVLFRKAKTLRILPMISRRFPQEASWFLEQMSDIPLPMCVPPSSDHDPIVRSQLVKGIRLGSAKLSDVLTSTEHGIQTQNIWDKLTFDGQLRKASAKMVDDDFESDSVICMVPDIFITEPAVRDGVQNQDHDNSQTNSMIRLLSTGDENIIMCSAIQALMEYHWVYGHFWSRFMVQFLSMVIFIVSNALMYFTIVTRGQGTSGLGDTAILGYGVITLSMSCLFIVQEVRQFMDDMYVYVTSTTNMLDLIIHFTSIFLVVGVGWIGVEVNPAIMAIVTLLSCYRVLLYLRIFPSVGPMVRITSTALLNVIPITIPMLILMFAYASAFFILHQGLFGSSTNYKTFWLSLQYTFTMFTFDYK